MHFATHALDVQVLRSLAFMHTLGLIHSDLKPENILIKSYSRCEVKVCVWAGSVWSLALSSAHELCIGNAMG